MWLKKYCIISFLLLFTGFFSVNGQNALVEVKAYLEKDTLYLENKQVCFTYYWNQGNIVLKSAKNKKNNRELNFLTNQTPNVILPGEARVATDAKIEITEKRTFPNEHIHKEISIYFRLADLEVKHRIKIYTEAAAISHTYFLKGKAKASTWIANDETALQMIEKDNKNDETDSERIASVPFDGNHWKTTIVSFKEATDHHDNLVFEKETLPYRKKENHQGNVLLATHPQKDIGFFLIKEAPIDYSQQYYSGYDFQIDHKNITVHGVGISPQDLNNEWVQGYGYAIGLSRSDKRALQKALLEYQKQLRKYIPARDGMILANTWGDRSKDSRMNEAFILKEIEQASKIGISHLQLDDGWQTGLSRNSASKAGKKWDDWSTKDWQPHPERFPNGFETIIKTAKKKNVEICLWFNPSKANSYDLWERDADILIDYYKTHGIKVFKIDGMSFANKQSEINLRKLFTKVMTTTLGEVTFNMDVTAGHRVGYHYFNEFGNIFLENRYTDWGNYYPHRTLRNLWQLSAYVPTERLQIEFLNNTRNPKKYPKDDVLAPGGIPLTYTSAITLVGQPLAWMEVSNLTNIEELQKQLESYKKISIALHTSVVLPLGEKPNGFSHTGFIAFQNGVPKHILWYREFSEQDTYKLNLPCLKSNTVFNRVFGDMMIILQEDNDLNHIKINSPKRFSYGVFLIE